MLIARSLTELRLALQKLASDKQRDSLGAANPLTNSYEITRDRAFVKLFVEPRRDSGDNRSSCTNVGRHDSQQRVPFSWH